MKITLEGREYELKANGRFMKKYQDTFKENMIVGLYRMTKDRDILACTQLIYCAIEEEKTFDEWLDSFESPIFSLGVMDTVMEYLTRSVEPTVESKGTSNEVKKKTI